MTDKKQLLKRFILEWEIKNYSSCVEYTKGLKSPAFHLRRPRSSWQLEVKVRDKHEIQVCLCKKDMTDSPPKIVRFLLCLKTLHGPDIWRYESKWLLFAKNCSFVSAPLILETNLTTVVTCVLLIMDEPRFYDPNVESLYREIESLFSNDGGTKDTNATLLVGKQKKRIKVHKEMLSAHSAMFDDYYRHNDVDFEILCYSPEVIVSILKFFYSGDITLLAKDKNIFELLSCASALGFSRLIQSLRSEILVRTSEVEHEDIIFQWNYTDSWSGDTGHRIFRLDKLGCSMMLQAIMYVDVPISGQTLLSIGIWLLGHYQQNLINSFYLEISVRDNDGCIHFNTVERMNSDSGELLIPIESNVLFGTDKVSFSRHVNFNIKIGYLTS